MGLVNIRNNYKPFIYGKCHDFWLKQQQAHWLPTEVQMGPDIQDWKLNLSETEKQVIAGILKGFIQTELIVNDYWQQVSRWFPHPEISMMASTFSSVECFDDQTELLTATGWKNVKIITMEDEIAQYDISSSEISFIKPNKVVSYDYKGVMHHYKNQVTDICVTPNHDLILIHPSSRKIQKKKSMEGKWGRNYLYPSTGLGIGKEHQLTDEERLLIAIQADGCLRGNCPQSNPEWRTCDVTLHKPRKIERLEILLNKLNITYSKTILEKRHHYTFVVPGTTTISAIKNFGWADIKNFSTNKATEFIEELLKWDGTDNRNWYNTNKQAIDFVQAVALLANISATVGVNRSSDIKNEMILPQGGNPHSMKTCYVVTFCSQKNRTYPHRKEIDYDGKVFCVSVPTQNIVSRRNKRVAITGNTIHTVAYAHLNDTLGIEDYDAFLTEPTAKAKIDRLVFEGTPQLTNLTSPEQLGNIARSLAVFSGFTEGVSLFSSFAVLFNFSRFNKLKGVGQIISWSILDESLHSEAGCWLFRELIKEHPELWTDELKKQIYDAARITIEIEDAFIDKVFDSGEVEGITPKEVKTFIRHRANVKLGELMCKTNWKNLDQEALKNMSWFDTLSLGVSQQDFFAGRETGYSKGSIDFSIEKVFGEQQ